MKQFIPASKEFKLIHLKGTYYEMGVQYGSHFKHEILYAIEHCVNRWGVEEHQWDKEALKNFSVQAFETIEIRFKDEIKGIADGARISLEDLLIWNFIDDYWEKNGCSAFAANGSFTSDGNMIIARNNDYEDDYSNEISITVVREPLEGIPNLCHSWAGLVGTYEGINLNGLVVTTQFSENEDRSTNGKSVKCVNLKLLENCSTIEEAIKMVQNTPLNFGCNILIADGNKSVVIECSGSGSTVVLESGGKSVSTNHFTKHISNPPQNTESYLTEERREFLSQEITNYKSRLDVDKVKKILKSPPIARYGLPDFHTLRSAIYIPKKRESYVAHGLLPAFEGNYILMNLEEILKEEKFIYKYPVEFDLESTEKPLPFEELNWNPEKAGSLGHGILDVWESYLKQLPQLPVLNLSSPEEVSTSMTFEIPQKGLSEEALIDYSKKLFFSNATQTGHPGFLAYIVGSGTVSGAIGDFIASAINQNVGGWNLGPAASEIELNLFNWFAEIFGLPKSAIGMVMSGGAMANFTAIKVARDTVGGFDLRSKGLKGTPQLIIYCSERSHVTIDRAADMLGLGMNAVRKIDTDSNFRMRTDKLTEAIESDLQAGNKPFIVVGTSGTTSFGSIDPLAEIATICKKYKLWFHVDGAYGALAILSDKARPLFKGIEHADSITFDPHKWLYMPQSASCVLFRNMNQPEAAFVIDDDYVYEDKEATKSGIDFSDFGPQWSRGFAALKIWFSLLAHGKEAFSKRISHDIKLVNYFAKMVQKHDKFELMTKPSLSICTFRYKPKEIPDFSSLEEKANYLDEINKDVLLAIQLDGKFFPSSASLNGQFVLRICIVNYRTEANHLIDLLDLLSKTGEKINKSIIHKSI
ncbi:MAG: aromatic-L-amino-acid decarboxylase [Gammaproteobacteria bacterium]|jgi:aromatic-L-amino-acid decarboxylase